jgi:ribosomal protein L39E
MNKPHIKKLLTVLAQWVDERIEEVVADPPSGRVWRCQKLITAPCRNVAVVVSEIPLPPSPVHAEIEGRRSATASGQNSEIVGDEVYAYSVSQATKTSPGVYRLHQMFHIPLINQTDNCSIDSSRNYHLYQAGWNCLFDCSKTVTIKQSKRKRHWHNTKIKCTCNNQLYMYASRSSQAISHVIIYAKMRGLRVRVSTVSFSLTCIYFALIGYSHI